MSPKKKTNNLPEDISIEVENAVETPETVEIEDTIKQSVKFIGQWQTLISTTNWEKGQIIVAWRGELAMQDLSPLHYSDESWSRIVGGVSPQHVGRLRRTYERFGEVYPSYKGIYWSHFYAALEWDDGEMWLEGAVQNRWSVSQMRMQRWESLGGDPKSKPKPGDIVDSEIQEELSSLSVAENQELGKKEKEYDEYVPGPRDERPDFGDDEAPFDSDDDRVSVTNEANSPAVRLFAAFENLPDDVSAAAEEFKLCIIRHKTAEWSELSRDQMVNLLDALKQLTLQG
jgi:hypothetical protein